MIRKLHVENIPQLLFIIHCCQPILIPLHIVICLFLVCTFYELDYSVSCISCQYPLDTIYLTVHIHFCATNEINCLSLAGRCRSKQQARQQGKSFQVEDFQPTRCKAVPSSTSLAQGKWSKREGVLQTWGELHRMASVSSVWPVPPWVGVQ